jgi:hypothetical protein
MRRNRANRGPVASNPESRNFKIPGSILSTAPEWRNMRGL